MDILRTVRLIILLVASAAPGQSALWTGNFTDATWTNSWAFGSAPAGKRNIIGVSNLALVVDSSAPGNGYLRITYPEGSYGSPTGGCQFYGGVLRTNSNTPRDSATLQYSVRFPTDFDFVIGGKLLGLYGGEGNTGTNFPTGADGFTTRLMWRSNAAGEGFPFLPNSPTNNLGTVLGRGNWFFGADGQWHTVRQDVVLNDAGSSNGYMRIWYDGVLVVDAPGLFFRSTDALKIDGVLFQSFFGGGDPSYATPVTTYADFAAFSVSELIEVASPWLASNYQATVMSQNPVYCFQFGGALTNCATNTISTAVTLSASGIGGFHHDYFNNRSNGWFFSDANDALWTPADLINGGGTPGGSASGVGGLSLLFRALDGTNSPSQSFIFSQGNSTASSNAFGLFIENDSNPDANALRLRAGNQTATILLPSEMAPGRWYFFALTYNEQPVPASAPEVIWYVGQLGRPLKSGTLNINNDAVIGDNGAFYLGNNAGLNNAYRNPGYGRVDELAIWHRELTGAEITNQFSTPFVPPILTIGMAGPNTIVLSWPKDSLPWLLLESASDLATDGWNFAGTPGALAEQLVVTNSAALKRFYRLRDP